jgi:hypothetical protein
MLLLSGGSWENTTGVELWIFKKIQLLTRCIGVSENVACFSGLEIKYEGMDK